jgi:hypothetical protein
VCTTLSLGSLVFKCISRLVTCLRDIVNAPSFPAETKAIHVERDNWGQREQELLTISII